MPNSSQHLCDLLPVLNHVLRHADERRFINLQIFNIEIRLALSAQEKESQSMSPSNSFFTASYISSDLSPSLNNGTG